MKWFGVAASLSILIAGLCADRVASQSAKPAGRTPVLVELFTSEGCSSCPPADQVLAQLDRQQPVVGAEIIAMSEHVDYWNSLGWKDPFSSAQFTDRQNAYATAFRNSGSYTPQMIVDGHSEFIGNDVSEAVQAIGQSARQAKASIILKIASSDDSSSKLHVEINSIPDAGDVYLAITEDGLSNNVTRGENKGQKLTHIAVVRKLDSLGRISPNRPFTADPTVRLARDWKRTNLHAVVFVQANKTHHVLALSKLSF